MADDTYLNDIEDVEVPAPEDGDVLYWDEATSLWKCKAPAVGGATMERVVRYSTDDALVWWNGSIWTINLTHNGCLAGYWNSAEQGYGAGMRFVNIYIPENAIITHAYLKLTARSTDTSTEVKTRIRGEKNAAPLTFSNIADYNARTRTNTVIDWDDIPSWTLGELYQSPDIKAIIQEIIDLEDWAFAHSIVIFWDDHDLRTPAIDYKLRRARSFNHVDPVPVMLYIEWTT